MLIWQVDTKRSNNKIAVAGVVSIQTSGAIWVGELVVVVLHICKEHLEAIPVLLFAYRAAMQVVWISLGG